MRYCDTHGRRLRCFPVGVRSSLPTSEDSRSLDKEGADNAHQLHQTVGSNTGIQNICQQPLRLISTAVDRQHHSSRIYKQSGRESFKTASIALAKDLCIWCMERSIHITPQYLPVALNTTAGTESRIRRDHSDWMLNPIIYHIRDKIFNPLTVRKARVLAQVLTQEARVILVAPVWMGQ